MRTWLVMVPLLVALTGSGCALAWENVQYCGDDGVCLPCMDDSECTQAYSCCTETWYCFHVDEESFAVCDLGCTTPSPRPCRCIDGVCDVAGL